MLTSRIFHVLFLVKVTLILLMIPNCTKIVFYDPWWVFRDNTTFISILNYDNKRFFRFASYDQHNVDSVFVYLDGYEFYDDSSKSDLDYRLRVKFEIFINKDAKNFIFFPENIRFTINDSLTSFTKIVTKSKHGSNYYYDLLFTYKSIENLSPIQNIQSSGLPGYLIKADLNKLIYLEKSFIPIGIVYGFQNEGIVTLEDDSYSPFK